jgi:hypothetical protein
LHETAKRKFDGARAGKKGIQSLKKRKGGYGLKD